MDIDDKHQRLEIGYTWLTPAYWRTAINTNCKYLLLRYCFEHLHLQRVQIKRIMIISVLKKQLSELVLQKREYCVTI